MRRARGKDTFDVSAAERDLWKALEQDKIDLAVLALTELIERLDAQLTAEIKTRREKY